MATMRRMQASAQSPRLLLHCSTLSKKSFLVLMTLLQSPNRRSTVKLNTMSVAVTEVSVVQTPGLVLKTTSPTKDPTIVRLTTNGSTMESGPMMLELEATKAEKDRVIRSINRKAEEANSEANKGLVEAKTKVGGGQQMSSVIEITESGTIALTRLPQDVISNSNNKTNTHPGGDLPWSSKWRMCESRRQAQGANETTTSTSTTLIRKTNNTTRDTQTVVDLVINNNSISNELMVKLLGLPTIGVIGGIK